MLLPSETDPSRSFDRPAVNLGGVTATGSYQNGRPVQVALSQTAITKDVELSASVHLFFDRFLWPKTVIRQAVCLSPSGKTVASLSDCTAPFQPFTEPEYNPVLREVIYRLPPGVRLQPATQYRLTVFAPPCAESLPAGQTCGPDAGSGLFAFDGAPLAQTYTFDFATKESGGQDEPAPSAGRYCTAQKCASMCANKDTTCLGKCGCLDGATCAGGNATGTAGDLLNDPVHPLFSACAFAPCHAEKVAPDPTLSSEPPMGLDLSLKAFVSATAVGATAHETQTGQDAVVPDQSGARFGRAMPIVDPNSPGTSYLVYKLLSNAQNYDASQLDGTDLADEIERLRKGLVVGVPMPAANSVSANSMSGGTLIDPKLVQLISDWIASGAVVTCPASK